MTFIKSKKNKTLLRYHRTTHTMKKRLLTQEISRCQLCIPELSRCRMHISNP